MRLVLAAVLVQRLVGLDPRGADSARVSDVADLALRQVEPDPQPPEQHDAGHEHRGRDEGDERLTRAARPEPGDQHAREEVREHRIDERHRRPDLALVEEEVRDTEAPEQYQQVDVQHPERAARVEERRHEQQAQRQPDVPALERPAEVAGVPTRHHPGGLGPLPCLDHLAGARVHRHVREQLVAREVPDHPSCRELVERDLLDAQVRVAAARSERT